MFVDHYSDHVFVHLMRNHTLEETLLAKAAYEKYLNDNGVVAKSYHADNGRFADKGFIDDCKSSNQTISFCGVGGHHQNAHLLCGSRTFIHLDVHAKYWIIDYSQVRAWFQSGNQEQEWAFTLEDHRRMHRTLD